MKKSLKLILFLILVISLLTACSNNDNNSTTEIESLPSSISETQTLRDDLQSNDLDYGSFIDLLIKNDFQYSEENTDTDSFLSVVRKPIFIENEIISIYEYTSNEEMENDSAYIDRGGCSISTPGKEVNISWGHIRIFSKEIR